MGAIARRLAIGGAICASALAWPSAARAYDPQFTHRWITRQAVERLTEAYPGQYDELLLYVDDVAQGVEDEDDPLLDGDTDPTTLRVQRHFYRPTDGHGLIMWDREFPSSYVWANVPDDINQWGWDDGMRAWREGDKVRAYKTLGHMVHLIQDATVPAHTHLDIHGPPDGDDYEDWCKTQITDEFTSSLPVPPAGALIPQFSDAWDAWDRTARASYQRNFYPGDLSDQMGARGNIAEMFPDLAWSWFFEDWRISNPSVGALGKGFMEETPGWFYFKNAEYPAAFDKMSFDPAHPELAVYGPNDSGAPMTELFARDLIPVAILHSAGVMKLYLDEMNATPVDPPSSGELPGDEPPAAMPGACAAAPGATRTHASGALAALFAIAALILIADRRRRNP